MDCETDVSLVVWYCNQSICVRWDTLLSNVFNVKNGVRQGGILSPNLFNEYIDDLNVLLSKLPVGSCAGDLVFNHLIYADDILLPAPSVKGMQRRVDAT